MRKLSLIVALLLVACGGADDENNEAPVQPERFPALEEAEPLDLSTVDLGVGVRSGGPIAAAFFADSVYRDVASVTPHAVLYLQAYDEAAPTFGEYLAYPAPAELMARPATQFIGANSDNARFEHRAADFYDEIDSATAQAGGEGFSSRTVVLDLWRLRRDWWVRWDGNLQDEANIKGKGPYGLNREAMYDDLLDQIEAVAQAQKPRYFIVGDEMDLLLAGDQGDGLSLAEFSNFLQFYEEAVARIKAQSPSTEVGAGINWDRFVENIAPVYVLGDETQNLEILDRAFQAVVLPLAEIGDIVALKSYRQGDDESITFPVGDLTVADSYQFLRRIEELYEFDKPLVFYSIGAPVNTPVGYLRQRNYLESFVEWTAGLDPALVAWRMMLNFAGTDTASQEIAERCEAFTTSERDFGLPITACYDGLITSVFSKKEPFLFLAGE